MKETFTFLLLFIVMTASLHAQPFWTDNFENATAPSSGTRTPSLNAGQGGSPLTAYFKRTNGSDINLTNNSDGAYSNVQGTFFWAGEDHDNATTSAGSSEQQIEFTNIDITGKTNLIFEGAFAAANSNAQWDNTNYQPPLSHSDFVIVEYKINAGTYQRLISFYGDNNDDRKLREDTDGNGLGDGTILSKSFQDFQKSIPGTGTTLSLRLRAFSNGSLNEEWAVDNFRVLEAITVPVNFGAINAFVDGDLIKVDWTTLSETNNDRFEVELSQDGKNFVTAGAVQSKAADGTASAPLSYSISIDKDGSVAMLGMGALLLLFLLFLAPKRKLAGFVGLFMIGMALHSCSKLSSSDIDAGLEKLYIRIVQIDKDGGRSNSKVILVDNKR